MFWNGFLCLSVFFCVTFSFWDMVDFVFDINSELVNLIQTLTSEGRVLNPKECGVLEQDERKFSQMDFWYPIFCFWDFVALYSKLVNLLMNFEYKIFHNSKNKSCKNWKIDFYPFQLITHLSCKFNLLWTMLFWSVTHLKLRCVTR